MTDTTRTRRITWNELTFDADVIHLAMLDSIALLTRQRDAARAEVTRLHTVIATLRDAAIALKDVDAR